MITLPVPNGRAIVSSTATGTTVATTTTGTPTGSPTATVPATPTAPTGTPPTAPPVVTWTPPQIDAQSSITVTTTVHLAAMPAGGALILRPQATAQGLLAPAAITGGALVVDPAQGSASVPFTPGNPATLQSGDGLVSVQAPGSAAAQSLTLRHALQPPAGEAAPPPVANFRRGLGTFYLTATDDQGQPVHQFGAPLTLTVRYTPEQLAALNILESDLSLYWYDPTAAVTRSDGSTIQGAWQSLATRLDPATRTATATVDHFTDFQLGDGSSPSNVYLPSIRNWQVSTFTGEANYAMPIEVPAGPGGSKPSLALAYNSVQTDGLTGLRGNQQAGWAGKGWTLDTGSIAIRKETGSTTTYMLVLNGQGYDLIHDDGAISGVSTSGPERYEWRTSDESFLRIRAYVNNDPPPPNRGGTSFGVVQTRYKWRVWTKDGTRYEFDDDLWWGFNNGCPGGGNDNASIEPYKWQLTRVVDTHGNAINYTNNRSYQAASTCFHVQGWTDADIWPETITWGANRTDGLDRYKVQFMTGARIGDNAYDGAPNAFGSTPHVTRQLNFIVVWALNGGNQWELVRQYNLAYSLAIHADNPGSTLSKLTLTDIQLFGSDTAPGTATGTRLPPTHFTYGTNPATSQSAPPDNRAYVRGDWNRLTDVNNGYGGTVHFDYETIGYVLANLGFPNNRRVTQKTITDGVTGSTFHWTYAYNNPENNSFGRTLAPDNWTADPQPYANSATLYLNLHYKDGTTNDYRPSLATPARSEFRGHRSVVETDPNGNQITHYFFQGDTADLDLV